MDDERELPTLVDMMALKIDGPALVFLRPRYPVPQEKLQRLAERLVRLRTDGTLVEFEHVKFVLIPHDFDVMVMGDVELEQAGLTRLTAAESL